MGWPVFMNKERESTGRQRPLGGPAIHLNGVVGRGQELVNFARSEPWKKRGGSESNFSPEERTLRVRLIGPALRVMIGAKKLNRCSDLHRLRIIGRQPVSLLMDESL